MSRLPFLRSRNEKSPEMGYDTKEYVRDLYRILLRREPDEAGFRDHRAFLLKGGKPSELLVRIINSEEFRRQSAGGDEKWCGYGLADILYLESWKKPDLQPTPGLRDGFHRQPCACDITVAWRRTS